MTRFMGQKLPLPEESGAWRAALELIAVAGLIGIDLWLPVEGAWLRAPIRALAGGIVLLALFRRRASADDDPPGARPRAWLEATLVTVALGLVVYAWAMVVSGPFDEMDRSILRSSAPVVVWWLLRRLVLAWLQQVVLQHFLWPLGREALGSGGAATLVVALLFGLFHLPSLAFAMATALGAALWLTLYRRSRRLLPLVVSHALLAAMASFLPDRLLLDMRVGRPALATAAEQRSLAAVDRQAMLEAVADRQYAIHHGDTDSGYVAGLYRDVLGRIATADEIGDGVEQLQTLSRLGLAKRMLLAPELDVASLWQRTIDDQPLAPGLEIHPGSDSATFDGWYEAEGEWRWARSATPSLRFRLERAPARDYIL
ncbi:MAG: CPBP family intramembrane glutamic endopeptidase, partial [Acidobacteriota bacterium]